jgi:hypothetical protein
MMTERREPYHVGRITQLTATPPKRAPKAIELIDEPLAVRLTAPPPDTILTTLERIRALCDEELARIERHGGCCRFAEQVRDEVGRVMR